MVGHGHRQWHVDSYHAHLDVVGEVASSLAIAGEYARAVAIFMVINQLHCTFLRVNANDAQHRAENFFLVDAHTGHDVVKKTWSKEESVFVSFDRQLTSVNDQVGAFRDADVDIVLNLVEMGLGNQRAHVVARVIAVTDFQVAQVVLQLPDHGVGRVVTDADGYGYRHAALAAGAVSSAHQGVDGVIDVGVRHDDGVIFRAAKRLNALAILGARRVNVLSDPCRADKTDSLDAHIAE